MSALWKRRGRSRSTQERRTALVTGDLVTGSLALVEEVVQRGRWWHCRVYFDVVQNDRLGFGGVKGEIDVDHEERIEGEDHARAWCDAVRTHIVARFEILKAEARQ